MAQTDRGVPRLVARGGLYDGLSVTLEGGAGERVIGSDVQCDMRIESDAVSPIHARFLHDEGETRIADAGSRDGTFINGQRVDASALLHDGDTVTLGAPGSRGAVTLLARIPGQGRAVPTPHRPTAEDFTTDPPSMVPEGEVGHPDAAPPPFAPEPPMLPKPARPPMSPARMAQLGGGALALGLVLYFVARSLLATAPAIHGVLPPRVQPGQALTLLGTGFGDSDDVRVGVGETEVAPQHIEPGQLTFEVPAALTASAPGSVPVRVIAGGRSSSTVYVETFLAPDIASLEPDVAMPGDEIVAHGAHLDGDDLDLTVGDIGAELLEASATRLRFRVPELSWEPGRAALVAARVETSRSKPVPLILGRVPLVTEITPARGVPGQVVSILGRGFGGDVAVAFDGQSAIVLSASEREIKVLAPSVGAGGRTRPLGLEVRIGSQRAMSSASFTLLRPSANLYLPRFFPQPVPGTAPDERLDVATELGPLLRLSGRGGAPSTPSRASRAAEAINALVTAGGEAQVEARQTNLGLVVRVVGRSLPLVTVTAADAAGYPNAPSVDRLARFWAALIGDSLDLFVHGRRPVRAAALTAHADVLLNLHTEASRRASGNGVPTALVSPPPRSLVEGLRQLALDFPSAAAPNPAIVVVGRWEGTFKEKDQPERRFRVELQLAGSRLRGTLSTGSGKVVGQLPLDDVSFAAGRLRFSTNVAGRPREFSGALEGVRIEGSITEGRGGAALGTFSLGFLS